MRARVLYWLSVAAVVVAGIALGLAAWLRMWALVLCIAVWILVYMSFLIAAEHMRVQLPANDEMIKGKDVLQAAKEDWRAGVVAVLNNLPAWGIRSLAVGFYGVGFAAACKLAVAACGDDPWVALLEKILELATGTSA